VFGVWRRLLVIVSLAEIDGNLITIRKILDIRKAKLDLFDR
jgi:hypothetical protein